MYWRGWKLCSISIVYGEHIYFMLTSSILAIKFIWDRPLSAVPSRRGACRSSRHVFVIVCTLYFVLTQLDLRSGNVSGTSQIWSIAGNEYWVHISSDPTCPRVPISDTAEFSHFTRTQKVICNQEVIKQSVRLRSVPLAFEFSQHIRNLCIMSVLRLLQYHRLVQRMATNCASLSSPSGT